MFDKILNIYSLDRHLRLWDLNMFSLEYFRGHSSTNVPNKTIKI